VEIHTILTNLLSPAWRGARHQPMSGPARRAAHIVSCMSNSVEVTWRLDDITMRGTLTLPDGDGPFPAVVMVAGSGPTDRDWCSPFAPGANGSGRLFAEAFADAGTASLRYDKRAFRPDAAESARALFAGWSMRSHLEELVAAVGVLCGHDASTRRARWVRQQRGHVACLHYATSHQDVPFAGIVLAAPPGRSVGELLLAQLALQQRRWRMARSSCIWWEDAAARYGAGQPMNVDPRLPDSVKMVLASFESPANLPLAANCGAKMQPSSCQSEIPTSY